MYLPTPPSWLEVHDSFSMIKKNTMADSHWTSLGCTLYLNYCVVRGKNSSDWKESEGGISPTQSVELETDDK